MMMMRRRRGVLFSAVIRIIPKKLVQRLVYGGSIINIVCVYDRCGCIAKKQRRIRIARSDRLHVVLNKVNNIVVEFSHVG